MKGGRSSKKRPGRSSRRAARRAAAAAAADGAPPAPVLTHEEEEADDDDTDDRYLRRCDDDDDDDSDDHHHHGSHCALPSPAPPPADAFLDDEEEEDHTTAAPTTTNDEPPSRGDRAAATVPRPPRRTSSSARPRQGSAAAAAAAAGVGNWRRGADTTTTSPLVRQGQRQQQQRQRRGPAPPPLPQPRRPPPTTGTTTTTTTTTTTRLAVFAGLALFRLLNTAVIQSAFDPDEYWQTLEPAYCATVYAAAAADRHDDGRGVGHHLRGGGGGRATVVGPRPCPGLTWEWTRRAATAVAPPSSAASGRGSATRTTNPTATAAARGSGGKSRSIAAAASAFVHRSLHGPVRSYASVAPTAAFYAVLTRRWRQVPPRPRYDDDNNSNDDNNHHYYYSDLALWLRQFVAALLPSATWMVARGPLLLCAVTVAAPTDYAVWCAAQFLPWRARDSRGGGDGGDQDGDRKGQILRTVASAGSWSRWWCLGLSLTAWFHAYALVRTLGNGQETALLALAVALVGPDLLAAATASPPPDAAPTTTAGRVPPPPKLSPYGWMMHGRACLAFFLGGVSVAIRFTAVAAFVPLGLLLAVQQPRPPPRRRRFRALSYLVHPCATCGGLGLAATAVVDRYFYGFWTLPVLGNLHFNVMLNQSRLYGTHPWHWYLTAGLPTVAGLLLPFVWYDFSLWVRGKLDRGRGNLWTVIVSYIVSLSLSAHKEFRFLLPMLPLWCLLTAPHVRRCVAGGRRLRTMVLASVWVGANFGAVLYLGLFHQTGPIAVNRHILRLAAAAGSTTQRIHYLTGACHSTPLHSHLHHPAVQFATWHLDCSPTCRAAQNASCESERFADDPAAFVRQSYCVGLLTRRDRRACLPTAVPAPDYVVTFSEYAPALADLLAAHFALVRVAEFPHGINGAKVGIQTKDYTFGAFDSGTVYGRRSILPGVLEVSVDEVVLFARKQGH